MKAITFIFFGLLNILFSLRPVNATESIKNEESSKEAKLASTASLYGLSFQKSFEELDSFLEEENSNTTRTTSSLPNILTKSTPQEIQNKIKLIEEGLNDIALNDNYVEYLMPQDLLTFPVGIRKTIGNSEFIIGIDSVVLTPTQAYMNAFIGLNIPGTEEHQKIYFYGEHIPISSSGGMIGNAKLELLTEVAINISPNTQLKFKGDQGLTFIEWDCSGFKSMALDIEILFSREVILPEDASGMPTDGFVTAKAVTQIASWDEFLLEVDIPKFQLTNGNGMSFKVRDAVFDMSDIHNSSGMRFPVGYDSPLFIEGNKNLWRGFYIRRAEVHLPQEITQEEVIKETVNEEGETEYDLVTETKINNKGSRVNNGRTSFLVDNLILDNLGVTGKFTAYNLITLEKGRLGTWKFSLEEIEVKITANQFEYTTLDGLIQLPLNSETKQLDYHAGLYGWQDYTFQVQALDTMDIPMFGASNVVVLPNSSLEVSVTSGNFMPKANLYGSMDIQLKDPGVSLAAMEFQNLQIQTVSPKISAEYFSVSSAATQQLLAGFGLSIEEVSFQTDPETNWIGLGIETSIAISQNFGGSTSFIIWGEETEKSYRFRKVQLKSIAVEVEKPGTFSLYGSVQFIEGDSTYGKGFQGILDLELENIDVSLEAMVLFGKVQGHRYWYADMLATFGTAGISMGTINLMGIGGGLYQGIEQKGISVCEKGDIGCSLSGIKYVPNKNIGLGFKATAVVSIPSGVITADATYEMNFTKHGGLNQISFTGSANVAVNKFAGLDLGGFTESVQTVAASGKELEGENLPEIATSKDIGLTATMYMLYDHPNKTFHASLELDINLNPLTGGGKTVLHFAPDKWYIHVGTPENPIAVNVAGLFNASGYFMAGHDMPEPPLPPSKVSEILKDIDLSYMDDLSTLEKGLGFAFGVHFGIGFGGKEENVNSGRKRFLIFYGKFNFGAGIDVMMANYGSDATCAGRSGNLGVNGWYANGQMYAYLEAEIGISVRRPRFIKGDYSIIDIAVAAVLQARGPNPFWMRGIVGAEYNILGGLIKGNCNFEFEMGEKCNIEGEDSLLSNIDIIADISPANQKTDVNVFTAPQVAFNMEVGKVFELKDYDGNTHRFRAVLDYFKVFHKNTEIIGDHQWNATNDVLIFNPYEILPGKKKLLVAVKIHFEEWKSDWEKVEGEEQEKAHVFVTGEEPNYLVASNIAYTYPIEKQFNFYTNEYNQGYIQLKSGRSNLFDIDQAKWKQIARFTTNSGITAEAELNYHTSTKEVYFDIPTSLEKEKVYKVELVQSPIIQTRIDANIVKGEKAIVLESTDPENNMNVRANTAKGSVEALQDNFLYQIHFRTSKYKTLPEKLVAMSKDPGVRFPIRTNVHQLINQNEGEAFDQYEIIGYQDQQLIEFEALWENQNLAYFDEKLYPLMYAHYPIGGQIISRDRNILGLIPVKAMSISQENNHILLTENQIEIQYATPIPTNLMLIYNLPHYIEFDYGVLRNKVANYYATNAISIPDYAENLINSSFPRIMKGTYPYLVKYRLPGKNTITSETTLTVNNPFEDYEQ